MAGGHPLYRWKLGSPGAGSGGAGPAVVGGPTRRVKIPRHQVGMHKMRFRTWMGWGLIGLVRILLRG